MVGKENLVPKVPSCCVPGKSICFLKWRGVSVCLVGGTVTDCCVLHKVDTGGQGEALSASVQLDSGEAFVPKLLTLK